MCRFLTFIFKVDDHNLQIISQFINALIKAAKNDPYLEGRTKGKRRSHDDGWGFCIIKLSSNEKDYIIHYYRSMNPIFNDGYAFTLPKLISQFKLDDFVLGLIHARAAGSGEPLGIHNVHPYYLSTESGYQLWFAHNGGVNKIKLANNLKLDNLVNMYSDSYFLFQYIVKTLRSYEHDNILLKYAEIVKENYVKSALNTTLIVHKPQDNIFSVIVTKYSRKSDDYYYNKYYEVKIFEKDSLIIYSSSTLERYLNDTLTSTMKTMDNGELHNLTIHELNGILVKRGTFI